MFYEVDPWLGFNISTNDVGRKFENFNNFTDYVKWKVTPLIRQGIFSMQHFIASALDLMPCLQARDTRDCN